MEIKLVGIQGHPTVFRIKFVWFSLMPNDFHTPLLIISISWNFLKQK